MLVNDRLYLGTDVLNGIVVKVRELLCYGRHDTHDDLHNLRLDLLHLLGYCTSDLSFQCGKLVFRRGFQRLDLLDDFSFLLCEGFFQNIPFVQQFLIPVHVL